MALTHSMRDKSLSLQPPPLKFGAERRESVESFVERELELPHRDEWLHTGNMSKKIVSNQGIKFQTRFAVLTHDVLYFTKQYDPDYMPQHGASITGDSQLQSVFKKYDTDASGQIDRDELKRALTSMDLFTTSGNFETIFKKLDSDASGVLDYDGQSRLRFSARKDALSVIET